LVRETAVGGCPLVRETAVGGYPLVREVASIFEGRGQGNFNLWGQRAGELEISAVAGLEAWE
jgi:hypothetical protein